MVIEIRKELQKSFIWNLSQKTSKILSILSVIIYFGIVILLKIILQHEISIFIFMFLPIFVCSFLLGKKSGILITLAISVISLSFILITDIKSFSLIIFLIGDSLFLILAYILGNIRDLYNRLNNVINERESLEKEQAYQRVKIIESEERLRAIFENATIGIFRTTPEGRVIMANQALLKMLRCPSLEALKERSLDEGKFGPTYTRSDFKEKIENEGRVVDFENKWRRWDGTLIFIRESAWIVLNSDGLISYYDGIIEDITERKKAELALQESEKRFRSIFENSSVGIYRTTPDGRILMANPACLNLLRFPFLDTLFQHNLEDEQGEQQYRSDDFRDKMKYDRKVNNLESEWVRFDSTILYVSESAWIIYDEEGIPLFYDGIIIDITDRKQNDEEREMLIIQLQKALGEIKTLSGMLPICSACKRIRDDTGYWHQIEEYVDSHSEAQFSHGICPECAKKLYPNYYDDASLS